MTAREPPPPVRLRGKTMLREIWVEWLIPPPLPSTTTLYEPAGVADEVVIVSPLVKVGEPERGRKEHEAPEGSPPMHERLTEVDGPPSRVTTIVAAPEPP